MCYDFCQDKLPEAEGSARKTLELALLHFGPESPAAAMAQLRLGATLLGEYCRFGLMYLVSKREFLSLCPKCNIVRTSAKSWLWRSDDEL